MSANSQQLVYQGIRQLKGEAFAQRWLLERGHGAMDKRTVQQKSRDQLAHTLREAISQSIENQAPEGEQAICLAQELLAPSCQKLGVSYPLALALVTMALEAGHKPGKPGGNNYHCLMTFEALGFVAARAIGREQPYTSKTIQRWLHHSAPHAKELRAWVGAKLWYTDTLINYSTGVSFGKVVGGHVLRVYTESLAGAVVTPHPQAMQEKWRNLEADIKAGFTASHAQLANVHIERTTLRDTQVRQIPAYDLSTPGGSSKILLEDYYKYPDIRQPRGVQQLRNDVQDAARELCQRLESCPITGWKEREGHYMRAVWVAVKHDIINNDRSGVELLNRAIRLSHELVMTPHTLKSPAAFVWKIIEDAGFRELRRDCPSRLIPKTILKQIGALA